VILCQADIIDTQRQAHQCRVRTMIEDPYATAKNAFMVNENYVNWRVLKGFESTGWQQLKSQGQDQVQLTINGYGALTFSALQKMGRFSNISEA